MPDLNKLQLPREFLIAGAAARTGLFDILHKEGALTAEQIARKAEADTRAVWTVMEALVAGKNNYHYLTFKAGASCPGFLCPKFHYLLYFI